MRLRHVTVWPLLCLLLAACGSGADAPTPTSSARTTFAIATGGPAGLYYPFGGAMASVWSQYLPHVNVKAEVTGGSVTNVIQVARGESEFGIAMADVVTAAYTGEGQFPEALPLRILLNAYPNIVHLLTLANTGVQSVDDLRGRRVSLGAAGSGTAVAAQNILAGLSIELQALSPAYLSFGETTAALKNGTIDAGFVVGGLGLAAVTELAVTRDLRLVALSEKEVSRLHMRFPAYSAYTIPAGTYRGVDTDVRALGIWSAVVVHEQMPAQLAFELVCTLFAHRDRLLQVSAVARDMSVDNLLQIAAVPLHEGTQRYLAAWTAQKGSVSCL